MRNNITKKRNNTIDIMKLIFSITVVLHHINTNISGFPLFERGLLAVDFFFIVSGYLFLGSVRKDKDKSKDKDSDNIYVDNLKFIWKKFKAFFPFVIVGFIGSLAARIVVDKIKIHTILNSVFSAFLLQMSGLPMSKINNVTWYLSVMLLSMFVLYPIIRKKEKKYINYFCPLIIVFGFGLFAHYFHNFDECENIKIIYNGLARGFLEINIGMLLAYAMDYIKKIDFTKFSKVMLTILEILGYVFVLIMMNSSNNKVDIFIVLVLSITIFISFSKLSYTSLLTDKLNFKNIDKLSLSIYCSHIMIILWMIHFNELFFHLNSIDLGICIFVVTIIISYVIEKLISFVQKKFEMTKLFIK